MEHNLPANMGFSPPEAPKPLHISNYYGQGTEGPAQFRYYWNILLKRKWWAILFFLGVMLATGVYTFTMVPLYKATTILQITQDNTSQVIGDQDPLKSLFSQNEQRFFETQYLILNSLPMGYRIIDTLDLTKRPEFLKLQKTMPTKSFSELRRIYAQRIIANLDILPLKRSFLVDVSYVSKDKALAQKVANVVSQEYVRFSMETRRQSYQLIRNWLEQELQKLADKVENSEKKLYLHGKQKDFYSLEKNNTIVSKYIELSKLLTVAQAERMGKEAQYEEIKQKGMDAPPITNNPLIQSLRQNVITQEAKVSSLKKIFGANYPELQVEKAKLQEFNQRLQGEVKRVGASIQADFRSAQRAEHLIRDSLQAQKVKVGDLQNNLVKHHILKRDMQTNEQLYQALLSRMKEASVASTMVSSNVAVITPAELPMVPYKPKKVLNLFLATLIGLVGGVGLAFVVEHFDDSLKTAEEMERFCQLPALGVVPYLPRNKMALENHGIGLITYDQPKSMVTEAIRQVRTSVMLSSAGGPPNTLVVTSPNPNEGKTMMSMNISISLAMNGRKVVLIDGDLRKPSISSSFGLPGQPGLTNYLSGNATLDDILRPTQVQDLFLIPAGASPPSPTELLESRAFEDLILELRSQFQHVVIDTPPIIEFADARVLSGLSDGVVLVVKHHVTSREAAKLAKQLLQQVNARIIGGVLNMSRANRLGYYGYGYYGYYKYYRHYYKKYLISDDNES
jgi:capsular exopolysaccharide synthesis family protein